MTSLHHMVKNSSQTTFDKLTSARSQPITHRAGNELTDSYPIN